MGAVRILSQWGGNIPMQKRLKPTAMPYIFKWSDLPSPASAERIRRGLKRKISVNTEADSVAWVSWMAQHRLLPSRQEVIQCEMDSLCFSIFQFRNDRDGIHFYSESF
ncbi:hypothetical protein LSH36_469g00005 [Paralvinella palmiformis]|uniref:Uncharacterized protein n=1 Tax=Paralvinella palmiformis TaxID=53620 RepID=A0AAD9J9M7_9ANNE|nr:hypothetical protein LSH36_469g00005 [Paralvinella palmiformis]